MPATFFPVYDLPRVATLVSLDFYPVEFMAAPNKRVAVLFEDGDQLREILKQHREGTLLVPVRRYQAILNSLLEIVVRRKAPFDIELVRRAAATSSTTEVA